MLSGIWGVRETHLFPSVALGKQGLQSPKCGALPPKPIQAGEGVPTPSTGVPHPMLIPASTSRATWSYVATEVGIAAARGCSSHHLSWPRSSLLKSGGLITAWPKASHSLGFPVCCHEAGLGTVFVLPPARPGGPHKWKAAWGNPCPCSAARDRFGPAVQSLLLG